MSTLPISSHSDVGNVMVILYLMMADDSDGCHIVAMTGNVVFKHALVKLSDGDDTEILIPEVIFCTFFLQWWVKN